MQKQTTLLLRSVHCELGPQGEGWQAILALKPQEPGHGSLHCSFIHAVLLGHSALMVHSGRQFGGIPTYCNKQLQEASSFTILHCEYGPHGEGMHGFLGFGSSLRFGEGSHPIKASPKSDTMTFRALRNMVKPRMQWINNTTIQCNFNLAPLDNF
uniref:Uncharacterized protein n=1 Tax=Glossina palpalis gambiensis TaxID=67801 RepID=A0A1B0C315_9MUSC